MQTLSERTDKLRQAKAEAGRIVEEYRRQKEAEYKAAEARVSTSVIQNIII